MSSKAFQGEGFDTSAAHEVQPLHSGRSPHGGIHHCLGNQLARQQLRASWRELLTRLPDIEACGEPAADKRALVQEAVAACPTGALSIED